jgi:alanine racemase
MTRLARVSVSGDALRANLARIRALAPGCRILAVIKANAYGHGAVTVARALEEADAFGVANVAEASRLREAGIGRPILVLGGFHDDQELETISRLGLWTVIHRPWQAQRLVETSLPAPVGVWLKIDTGMHRLGLDPDQFRGAWDRLARCRNCVQPPVPMTHLACADDPAHPAFTLEQLRRFQAATEGLSAEASVANSAALLAFPETRTGWIRPGLLLYGAWPLLRDAEGRAAQWRPAMRLSAPVIAVRRLRAGDTIGYGAAWTCPEDMAVAVVAAGYADGYPRHVPAGTPVGIGEGLGRVVGRISMDMITVDLRGLPPPRVGDEAVLWGGPVRVDEVARRAGTIPYELLCAAGRCVD